MEFYVSYFFQFFADYGVGGLIVFVLLMLLWKYAAEIMKKLAHNTTLNNEPRLNNREDLKFHSFFSNAQYRIMVEIPEMEFNPRKPVRQRLCRDLLYFRIKTTYIHMLKFIESPVNEISSDEWSKSALETMRQISKEFRVIARDKRVPTVVIEKFTRWNRPTDKLINEYIVSMTNSSLYINNVSRTNALLLILNLALVTTIGDAENTLRELNGEISGLKYKGSIIE